MYESKSGAKTLIWSIIMSSPGPLVVGLSLLSGRSATQIADFLRRTAEFLAIVMSAVTFMLISKDKEKDEDRRKKLESRSNLFVGAMMCLAGIVMAVLAIFVDHEDKGNVIPSLIIAVLSAGGNSIFWHRYTHLKNAKQNVIFATQARLYRAKTLIDSGVIVALTSVIIAPDALFSIILDIGGSVLIAAYLIYSGIYTVKERNN